MEFCATNLLTRPLTRLPLGLCSRYPDINTHLAGILISQDQIQDGVARLATALARDYQTRKIGSLVVLYVPQGAKPMNNELLKYLGPLFGIKVDQDIIKATRFNGNFHGGDVTIEQQPTIPLAGRDVLIIEDLVDEGYTGQKVIEYTLQAGAKSVRFVSLLRKPESVKVDLALQEGSVKADHYSAFDIAGHWVVGFGMDTTVVVEGKKQSVYRDLPFVGVADPKYLVGHNLLLEQAGNTLSALIRYED